MWDSVFHPRCYLILTNDISFDALKSCGGTAHISKYRLHWTFQEFLAFKGLGEWQKYSKKTVFPGKLRKIVAFSKKKKKPFFKITRRIYVPNFRKFGLWKVGEKWCDQNKRSDSKVYFCTQLKGVPGKIVIFQREVQKIYEI